MPILPGDRVLTDPTTFPALRGMTGIVLDEKPSDLHGFDFRAKFAHLTVLLYRAEVVPA